MTITREEVQTRVATAVEKATTAAANKSAKQIAKLNTVIAKAEALVYQIHQQVNAIALPAETKLQKVARIEQKLLTLLQSVGSASAPASKPAQ